MKLKEDKLLTMAQDADLLTMGIAVSGHGDIHIGHRVTMMNFLRTLAEFRNLPGLLVLEDREHSNVKSAEGAIVRCGVDSQALNSIRQNVAAALAELSGFLSLSDGAAFAQRFKVMQMSEFYAHIDSSTQTGAEGLVANICKSHRDRIFTNYFGDINCVSNHSNLLKSLVRPLSPDLKSSPRRVNKYRIDAEEGIIDVDEALYHDAIERGSLRVDMLRNTNWSLHFLITGALRDTVLALRNEGQSILHIFGGDYAAPRGASGKTTVERIAGLAGDLTASNKNAGIKYFTGPLLTRAGQKISKSLGNAGEEHVDIEQVYDFACAGQNKIIDLAA